MGSELSVRGRAQRHRRGRPWSHAASGNKLEVNALKGQLLGQAAVSCAQRPRVLAAIRTFPITQCPALCRGPALPRPLQKDSPTGRPYPAEAQAPLRSRQKSASTEPGQPQRGTDPTSATWRYEGFTLSPRAINYSLVSCVIFPSDCFKENVSAAPHSTRHWLICFLASEIRHQTQASRGPGTI